ncbi:hypothetical protein PILCRDRAFT_417 [Piloderma croceum F 1598]|uniref:VWFA domain-containing protein n=1 Tax=Piloderma croceum (strain F 1598) TaxID=765440 RepID=A0A0C3GP83_PILCF|nr:hypothetical protein PILCRDRAFT_417 [Piloderma croceum F 1598]
MDDSYVPADVFPLHQAPARFDGSKAPDAQMPPPGVLDSNDEDSDDMYGPYPPYDTRPPAESDHSDGKIDEADEMDLDHPSPKGNVFSDNGNTQRDLPNLDLSHAIKGMYRILDLISEQGSGGLVDKIIISQDSLRAFINTICPGAYASLTKVDFKTLDSLTIKPIGIYGSREEIVRFLSAIGAVDDALRVFFVFRNADKSLRVCTGRTRCPPSKMTSLALTADEQLYVLYWPQDTTWDDSALSSVRRNRVTFMRYLLKMCDQVVALISSEHANTIVWNDEDDATCSTDAEHDESDRLFTFEVAKTNEQEETVTFRPGFQLTSRNIAIHDTGPECPIDPKPRLLFGETMQGFMTSKYQSAKRSTEPFERKYFNRVQLRDLLESGALHLSEDMDGASLDSLVECGLRHRFPDECKQWNQYKVDAHKVFEAEIKEEAIQIEKRLQAELSQLERVLHEAIIDAIIRLFPTHIRTLLSPPSPPKNDGDDKLSGCDDFSGLAILYPGIGELLQKTIQNANLSTIESRTFKHLKESIITIDFILQRRKHLDERKRLELIRLILDDGDMRQAESVLATSSNASQRKPKGWLLSVFAAFWPEGDDSDRHGLFREARDVAFHSTDAQFLLALKDIESREPLLRQAVAETEGIVRGYFNKVVSKLLKTIKHKALHIQQEDCKRQYQREASSREEQDQHRLRIDLIRQIENSSRHATSHTHSIDFVEEIKRGYGQASYQLTGLRESLEAPSVEYTIHLLSLTTQDQQTLQLDPTFVPAPNDRFSYSFGLPDGYTIVHGQLLQNDRLLLIVIDRSGNLLIFLEYLNAMDGAVKRNRPRTLHRDKIGHDFLLAFDESKRMLAVCASTKLFLHIFVFDECYGSMQALGSAVNLIPWYNDETSICHACFVCGSQELLLVDSSAQARIFSLDTLQFRPATLHLQQIPVAVYSSPDGSCLLVSHAKGGVCSLTAYHWSTFGSTEGISLGIADLPVEQALILTSLVNRNSVHLMQLDLSTHRCYSFALDITRKVTEFMFKEKGVKIASGENDNLTMHNCLIDCHAEVWTRFPVLPAVRRQTISSSSERSRKTLVFVSDRDHQLFLPHFADMIQTFERTTRKPTGEELKTVLVSAMSFSTFTAANVAANNWAVSRFRTGEWLVDFLCLIPIHIAITRENRFIPLKDGVSSAELEKSLLGAEVGRIVDSLSFGWYESLFQSYMVSKPVKVVSSMGEQSVGKSYALNHLVDTSFAGSAMRTTEGVWMSVTPTDDALIVALDFEGVHSIERSAQEDTLLVLFNTAISNLVLFRNNFALSRDIAGLFQSFQSSSTVLDPAANLTLFQSTLVIIIKDVVDSDKAEIAREFSLKFGKIVQEEQDANFISRLHRGRLDIVPWPVIESKEFYRLFPILKKRLDQQFVTHNAAGEFLHTLKTLMAKLKANDWGALSQTMAAHRAQLLLSLLPNALAFGFSEVEPEVEPLKNFDTDAVVNLPDTTARLFLAGGGMYAAERETVLAGLRRAWNQNDSRQLIADTDWISMLSLHLEHLVNLRIDHVREWITTNLLRFQTAHANIEELRRTFESATVDLKANVQLCKMHQEHSCTSLCSEPGICEIDTAPHSIEATFTGKHETFQYTKYSQVAKRLKCTIPIPAGTTEHQDSHCHKLKFDHEDILYSCESCGYFCTLPLGHSQQDHDTRHGSMSQTRWAIDGTDDTSLELDGRKFSSNDDGAPMMCNLVCQAMGRHVHIDYCRTEEGTACEGTEPVLEKKWIQRSIAPDILFLAVFSERTSLDPYSRDDQANFSKCDAMCGGPEHCATATVAAQPSYCTLPMFHPPRNPNNAPAGLGYISNDGHLFSCKNPVIMQQAFHVIFVIDRSGSMSSSDRRPLSNSPATGRIVRHSDNRLGAVYSSLDSFWSARHAAVTRGQQATARRDSYSVILFDHTIVNGIVNDFTSSPDQLLEAVLQYRAAGGTNFTAAIKHTQTVMEQNWSTERTPVVIFLSDGICSVADQIVQDICRSAVRLGKPLSFHAVSFGQDSTSSSLRRMAQIAQEVQNNAPRDPLAPAAATVSSSYAEALDTVRLAETFLGIAESLRKPRGSLLR